MGDPGETHCPVVPPLNPEGAIVGAPATAKSDPVKSGPPLLRSIVPPPVQPAPPVVAAATKASWIRTFAEREGLSLSDSYAYTDSMSDLPMLSVVGHPAAINPDMRLRQTALHHDWPILNLK